MLHAAEHALEHTINDSLWVILAMFLTYLAMEYLEHRTGDGVQRMIQRAGRLGPMIGAAAGIVPQCGLSAAAANLYAGRVITLGTLIAIYLSTSDEMLPVMIASKASIETILGIVSVKLLIGMAAGFVLDYLAGKKPDREHGAKHGRGEDGQHERHGQDGQGGQHGQHGQDERHGQDGQGGQHGQHGRHGQHGETGYHIHELCEQEHCDCEKGIFRSALHHTVRVGIFLILISYALNLALEILGEDALPGLLLNRPILGPFVAGVVGLIPNCAASVAITELYLEGLIDPGAMLAGLLVGSGVGLLVLFRVNRPRRENFKIAGLLYLIGVLSGIAAEFLI